MLTARAHDQAKDSLKSYFGALMTRFGHPRAQIFLSHGIAGTGFTHFLAVSIFGFASWPEARAAQADMDVNFIGLHKAAKIEPLLADGADLWITRFQPSESALCALNTAPRTWAVHCYANLKIEGAR